MESYESIALKLAEDDYAWFYIGQKFKFHYVNVVYVTFLFVILRNLDQIFIQLYFYYKL